MNSNEIVDEFWASFTYNGDNNTASQYVSSIIKCLNGASNIQYGRCVLFPGGEIGQGRKPRGT